MANPWFRMYAEFISDPKVQMMSEALQRRFVMLMGMRCSSDDATLHATEIAFVMRISEGDLAETKAVFLEKGFIDEDWNLINWDKRQFVSDSSTERSKRCRARHKEALQHPATDCNVAATPPDTEQIQNRTEQKDLNLPAGKRQAETKPEPDERHKACREHVHAYWRHRHPEDTAAPWDGSESAALSKLLKAKPDLTPERFRQLLYCRDGSEQTNHSERPRRWLQNLTDYASGPLDRFSKLLTLGPRPEAIVGVFTGQSPSAASLDGPHITAPPAPDQRMQVRAAHLRKTAARRELNAEESEFLAHHDGMIAELQAWQGTEAKCG